MNICELNICEDRDSHQIQASTIHVLHADVDLAIAVESSIEADNVGRVALVKNPEEKSKIEKPHLMLFQPNQPQPPSKKYLPELCDDLLLDGRLHLQMDHLLCNDSTSCQMTHTVNHLEKIAR